MFIFNRRRYGRGSSKRYCFQLFVGAVYSSYFGFGIRKILNKTAHRKFLPSFDVFAKWCMRIAVPFTIITALIMVPAYLAQKQPNFVYGASGFR